MMKKVLLTLLAFMVTVADFKTAGAAESTTVYAW